MFHNVVLSYNLQFVSTIFIEICNSGKCMEFLVPAIEQLPVKVTLFVFNSKYIIWRSWFHGISPTRHWVPSFRFL